MYPLTSGDPEQPARSPTRRRPLGRDRLRECHHVQTASQLLVDFDHRLPPLTVGAERQQRLLTRSTCAIGHEQSHHQLLVEDRRLGGLLLRTSGRLDVFSRSVRRNLVMAAAVLSAAIDPNTCVTTYLRVYFYVFLQNPGL